MDIQIKRRQERKAKIKELIFCIVLFSIGIFIWISNNEIVTTKYKMNIEGKGKGKESIKIAQISDLHNKEFVEKNSMLINRVKEIEPDMIVITGDFIDSNITQTNISVNLSKELVKIAPVYYITGNHERLIDDAEYIEFEEQLKETGVEVLINRVIKWNENVNVIGLDDQNLSDNTLQTIMEDVSKEDVNILLAHEPQELEWYAKCGVDVVLSGHAHGGQVRIPFTDIGLVAPDQGFLPKYTSGLHQCENTQMIISRGLGNSIIPLRVFNHPELVQVEVIY